MADEPDIRVRLSAEGLDEVVSALKRIRDESQKTAKTSEQGFQSFGKSLENVKRLLAGLGLAVGIVEVTRRLGELLSKTSELARELRDMQDEFGGASSGIVALGAAAKITETSTGQLRTGVVSLAQAVKAMRDGEVTPATKALTQLGLAARNFNGLSLAQQLALVSQKFAGIADGTTKAALAADLFGKRVGLGLIPLLNFLGREGLAGVRKQLEQTFTPEAIAAVADLRQALNLLQLQIQGQALQFLSGFSGPMIAALEGVSTAVGSNQSVWERWGLFIGQVVGRATLVLGDLFDLVTTATEELKVNLSTLHAFAVIATSNSIEDIRKAFEQVDRNQKQLEALSAEFKGRRSERQSAFNALSTNTFATPKPTPGGIDVTAADNSAKQLVDRSRALADAQLALVRERVKAAEAEAKGAFDRGLISVRSYYEERRRLLLEAQAAEIKALEDGSSREVALLRKRLAIEKAGRDAQVKSLESEARATAAGVPTANPVTQEQVSSARAQAHEADVAAQAQLAAATNDNAQRRGELETKLQTQRVKNAEDLRALDDDEARSVQDLGEKRLQVERRVAQLRGDAAEQSRFDNADESRKAQDLLAKAGAGLGAGAIGPPIPIELLNEDQRALVGLKNDLDALLAATIAFQNKLAEAQSAEGELNARRGDVEDRVNAGLVSRASGERQILKIEQDRIVRLRDLATALRAAADATGNEDLKRQADDFDLIVQRTALHLEEAASFGKKLAATLEDAVQSNLANFFAHGIDQANGFREAVIGVIQSLRDLASQELARAILNTLVRVLSFAGLKDGGLAGLKDGGMVTPRGVSRRRFTSGGMVYEHDARPVRYAGGGVVIERVRRLREEEEERRRTRRFTDGGVVGEAERRRKDEEDERRRRRLHDGGYVARRFTEGGVVGEARRRQIEEDERRRRRLRDGGYVVFERIRMPGGASITRVPGLARGGYISGPGSPTSDSIHMNVPTGTFIVKAASVRRVGALQRLRQMVAGSTLATPTVEKFIPIRVSNGEFAVPPEVARRPGALRELEHLNRFGQPLRLVDAARAQLRFGDGGIVMPQPVAGAAGAAGQAGAGGIVSGRIVIAAEPGTAIREVQTPAGQKVILEALATNPRQSRRALGLRS